MMLDENPLFLTMYIVNTISTHQIHLQNASHHTNVESTQWLSKVPSECSVD